LGFCPKLVTSNLFNLSFRTRVFHPGGANEGLVDQQRLPDGASETEKGTKGIEKQPGQERCPCSRGTGAARNRASLRPETRRKKGQRPEKHTCTCGEIPGAAGEGDQGVNMCGDAFDRTIRWEKSTVRRGKTSTIWPLQVKNLTKWLRETNKCSEKCETKIAGWTVGKTTRHVRGPSEKD